MLLTLFKIKELVDQLAEKINAPQNTLPSYGNSKQLDGWNVEVDSSSYHLISAERGIELEKFTTADIDDLLYKIFSSVTFTLSCEYELAHRVAGQDCRRIIFQHQLELLSTLSPKWSQREKLALDLILSTYPFDDAADVQTTFDEKLKE